MRRAAKIDDNQGRLVRFMRGLGASVAITSSNGKGFTDVVVGLCGVNRLVEIKDADKAPSARRLTPDERDFHMRWGGAHATIDDEAGAHALLVRMAQEGMRQADAMLRILTDNHKRGGQ